MWRHFEHTKPVTGRSGAQAIEVLLGSTRGPDGHGCTLTRFTEAFRRGDIVPDPTEQEREAIALCLVPAVNALIDEALAQAGATRDDMQQERNRRRGMVDKPPMYNSTREGAVMEDSESERTWHPEVDSFSTEENREARGTELQDAGLAT